MLHPQRGLVKARFFVLRPTSTRDTRPRVEDALLAFRRELDLLRTVGRGDRPLRIGSDVGIDDPDLRDTVDVVVDGVSGLPDP
jgi:hypothetical protein